MTLRQIHYQLLNTVLIITYNNLNKCFCYKSHGCRQKPKHGLSGIRNYCTLCQIRETYDINKIYKLDKITDVFNTYLELKTDLQLHLDFGYENFWLYDFKSSLKRKFNSAEKFNRALKFFIINSYYDVCYNDP